jgi:hypothetical protein
MNDDFDITAIMALSLGLKFNHSDVVSQPLQDDKEFAKPVPIELSPTSQKIPIS